nr:pyruvate carboxylase [uncultured Desulfobacter sp.]
MDVMGKKIKRLLIANRSEIAIRVTRAAHELGIDTIGIYSQEDRFALHRFKTGESYLIGEGKGPIEAYLDFEGIVKLAKEKNVDAIHPGYGFLAEKPEFADACAEAGIKFVGPSPEVMRQLGNKVSARKVAIDAGAPVVPASGPLPYDDAKIIEIAEEIGYPLMLKASWGGGGRGMRAVESTQEVLTQVDAARKESAAAFGSDEVYFEKLVRKARHLEVQILGDSQGNIIHLFERDCSVQRRNQKVVERAPATFLTDEKRQELCNAGLSIAKTVGYESAGTVEFLMDIDTGKFYFMEVNPRIQVEHTVTEQVTGVDIVKAQLKIAQGMLIGQPGSLIPKQEDVVLKGHAIQCRITTEDPENNFIPDYGRITAYRAAAGFGIRLDAGTAYSGAIVTRHFDSLLTKVTAWGGDEEEARLKMHRALTEFRILGVATNLQFLEGLIRHPTFVKAEYTTKFIDETKELFTFAKRRDRATRLLSFLGDVIINGNEDVKNRPVPAVHVHQPTVPKLTVQEIKPGLKQLLDKEGPQAVADWMKTQDKLLITDKTMRDAHQSLLATRVRTFDLVKIAPSYAALLPDLFSVECWGGATFDVAMRFSKECPWERLQQLREAMPNLLTQMLLRASNGVGYTNYPDNVITYFVKQAADNGMDLFRVFDSLNWVENMRLAMDAVLENNKICEASICYTGDILDPKRTKYSLKYYVDMAKELEKAGAHILAIKDMAGLLKPAAAKVLVGALKEEIGLPIHLHSHDTSGIAGATLLAAADAGVDAIDCAVDSMSGLTSHPNLGSIAAALRNTPRDTGLDPESLALVSNYWEKVRQMYIGFESEFHSGTSEVYLHEMPGGQYTNLRQQARALGIEERWPEVAKVYKDVNEMFGDIVKVTPSSKVVGDMALSMITSGITKEDVLDPNKEVSFPESVVTFFKGMMGQPPGGFPKDLQKKILKGEEPITVRPGQLLEPADMDQERAQAEKLVERKISDCELASYLMYPDVFVDYMKHRKKFGNVSVLPTLNFFYGMKREEELYVDIASGKTLIIRFMAKGKADEEGNREVYFELNGQSRIVKVPDRSKVPERAPREKANPANLGEVGSPMPGLISAVCVSEGDEIERGDVLVTIEAMKMQTNVLSDVPGVVQRIATAVGSQVDAKDLLVVIKQPEE